MENSDIKINVLVVDDEQIILDSIKKLLRNEAEYNVMTALSVPEAYSLMDKEKIQIVLTDLMMPDIDGLEFLKTLREKSPNIIAVMITGYATINTALQAMQLGAFDYLAKPFTREELKKLMKRAYSLAVAIAKAGDVSPNPRQTETEKIMSSFKGIGEYSWLKIDDKGNVLIGVERTFLITIGRIQSVYLPSPGDEIRQGSIFFQVFSNDLRSQSLLSPLSGEVIKVNDEIHTKPNEMLEDPYGKGWLIKLRPTKLESEIKLIGK
ncbi:MAG: response regulator [Ignavibacteriae bacterium]|nr:response regulator [Ignavibacteriota bacterium]